MIEPGTHKLSEAMEGHRAGDAAEPTAPEAGKPEPSERETAEQARREEEARSHGRPDRDDYLTNIGRGQQTHG